MQMARPTTSTPAASSSSALIADEWEFELREGPEQATQIGDYRYNDRWTRLFARQGPACTSKRARNFSPRLQPIDTSGFPEQEKLDQVLMVRNLKDRLEVIDKKLYEMPVNQFSGVQISLPQQISIVPFDSTQALRRLSRAVCTRCRAFWPI